MRILRGCDIQIHLSERRVNKKKHVEAGNKQKGERADSFSLTN